MLKFLSKSVQILAIVLFFGSCKQQNYLNINCTDIPLNAASLHISIIQGNFPTQPIDPISLLDQPSEQYRFALYLPDDYSGDLQVSIGALDSHDCLIATGVAALQFQPPLADVTIVMNEYAGPADTVCTSQDLRILDIQQRFAKSDGHQNLTVLGWGFQPGAKATIGNKAAETFYTAPNELKITTPHISDFGLAQVKITNPSRETTTRGDLLRIYAGTVGFVPLAVARNYKGISALNFGLYDPSKLAGFALAFSTLNTVRVSHVSSAPMINNTITSEDYTVGDSPSSLFTVDIDRDGDLDILVGNAGSNSVQLMMNDGKGKFALGPEIPIGFGPEAIVAGDLDNDGDIDIVTIDKDTGGVSILLNEKGIFHNNGDSRGTGTNARPVSVALGDLNNDDFLDIAIANQSDGTINIFFNEPLARGHFANRTTDGTISIGRGVSSVLLNDIDKDGRIDLLASVTDANRVAVYLNHGNFTSISYNLPTEAGPNQLMFMDVNSDGFGDLVVACSGDQTVNVFLNNPGAGFRGVQYQSSNSPCDKPMILAGVDPYGSGKASIGVGSESCFAVLANESE